MKFWSEPHLHRVNMFVLLVAALAIVWSVLGGR
jgi:hypothetical protein